MIHDKLIPAAVKSWEPHLYRGYVLEHAREDGFRPMWCAASPDFEVDDVTGDIVRGHYLYAPDRMALIEQIDRSFA